MPGGAAKLAVGDGFQADVLLELHDLADGLVLRGLELVGLDTTVREVLPRLEESLRAQQAADVVGAERRCGPPGHPRAD